MNFIIETFASEGWSNVIAALLHTLWIGGIATLGLFVALRFTVRPEVRYRWCVSAMTLVFLGGLVTWGVLQEKATRRGIDESTPIVTLSNPSFSNGDLVITPTPASPPVVPSNKPGDSVVSILWTPWLALLWLVGSVLMLVRSALCVASAEGIRNNGRPLEDEAILQLLEETRRRLGIVCRIRVVLTEKLTTPAVMGVLLPTLILPLPLVTSMSLQQLQFVFLHELAHVRRGDYLANLCQLLIESLLFFNPAIWWISRQMRHEREACCDAIAIELTGGRIEYAETLARVAEGMIAAAPRTVPAFGERKTSSLMDRVQRILVPGYRPGIGFTWKALFAALFIGGLLLILSAVGTRFTVSVAAKLLTPEERIELIETKLAERGTRMEAETDEKEEIEVRGTIQTEDGSPVPKSVSTSFLVNRDSSSVSISAQDDGDGVYTYKAARGDLYFSASHDDYAPAVVGPLDTRKMTERPELNLVLKRGFTVSFSVIDTSSGKPIPGAMLKCQFWFPNNLGSSSFQSNELMTDSEGIARLDHCAVYPLTVKLEKEGYEYEAFKFDLLQPNHTYEIRAHAASPVRGVVLDERTGAPVPNAALHVFSGEGPQSIRSVPGSQTHQYQSGAVYGFRSVDPWNPGVPLTTTDEQGRFTLNSLPAAGVYSLLVDAPGYTQVIIPEVRSGNNHLRATLSPEVVLQGRISGDLNRLHRDRKGTFVRVLVEYRDKSAHVTSSYSQQLPVQIEDGVGRFVFTNRFGDAVVLRVADQRFEPPSAPNTEWNIEITDKDPLERREVVLRFVHPSGVPPKGTISVTVPNSDSEYLLQKEVEIKNGEVRVLAKVGYFNYEPARTIGYWFTKDPVVEVPAGDGPFVIIVPVIPAGAIYAKARNADGSPATDVSFSVMDIEKSPLISNQWTHVEMREGVATSLPLGGTYRIRASRHYSVCLSEPIKLTEKQPDREVTLEFNRGVDIEGQLLGPEGKPIPNSTVTISWHYQNSSFGLLPIATDHLGRFRFNNANVTPGEYNLTFRSPGMKSTFKKVDLAKLPLLVKLEPGLKLSGRVVEKKSGQPIPEAPVRIYGKNGEIPSETKVTDALGNFTFDTLHDTSYGIHVAGANYDGNQAHEYRPGEKPIVLEMVLPHWSKLKVAKK